MITKVIGRRSSIKGGARGGDIREKVSKAIVRQMIESRISAKTEPKFLDMSQTLVGLTQAYQFFGPLTAPPQGDTDSSRSGDQIAPLSLKLTIQLISSQIASSVRLILFRWGQSSVVAPTQSTVMNVSGSNQYNPFVYPAVDYEQNVHVLRDVLVPMGVYVVAAGVATVGASPIQKTMILNISKGLSQKIQFSAGSTNATNHVFVGVSTDAAATQPQFGMQTRFRYLDA
jgi:hypothetical protein